MGLVHGLVKKGTPGYSNDDFEKVIDPAVLTTHADNWKEKILDIRKEFKKNILPYLKEAETSEESNILLSNIFDMATK
jgi:hypothetical protein